MMNDIHSCSPYCDRPECAAQTPLVDLLADVPEDATANYEESTFCSHSIPYGRYCREALAEIKRLRKLLQDANRGAERNAKVNEGLAARVNALTAERDELRRRIEVADKVAVVETPYGNGHNFLDGLNQSIGTYALVRLKDDEL